MSSSKAHGDAWRDSMRAAALAHERMGNDEEAKACHRRVIRDARLEASQTLGRRD